MTESKPNLELDQIIESAKRLGVELDEADALQWLTAMSAVQDNEVSVDIKTGVFGHKISMLDFNDQELDRFRRMGKLVEFEDVPGKVETALALSGSAAQSKIQSYPGDADYFERVNIIADTKEEACRILADLMFDKVTSTIHGADYEFIEAKFGSYPYDVIWKGERQKAGSPISWPLKEIQDKGFDVTRPDGTPDRIEWDKVAQDPGWCKLDWIVADPVRKKLVNASNMLDVTWEAPDGQIIPLDGYLDSFFQEVYLDADSIPIFSKLVKHVSGNALDDYVHQLEKEVYKYTVKSPNYGKAAKRMYNIFRLTGKYIEAAYLRELFDEPTTILYQVWTLIRTIDESFQPGSMIEPATILGQADKLIIGVVDALEGEKETEIVKRLLKLKEFLAEDVNKGELSPQAEAARAEVINIVNNFFYEKLTGIPQIQEYMDNLKKK
jgi:hypothetical protein